MEILDHSEVFNGSQLRKTGIYEYSNKKKKLIEKCHSVGINHSFRYS